MLYVILSILMFGLLIAVHEFGHFITAKRSGVRVNEFSIGMGPLLWKKEGGETQYSLRLLPVGGYCAMEGEDGDSEDPRAFGRQNFWKKALILVAGSAMNFLAGLVILVFLFGQSSAFYVPVVGDLDDGFPLEGEQGLMVGDRICSINGEAVFTYTNMVMFLDRAEGEPMDMVIRRDGKKITLTDLPLEKREYTVGETTVRTFGIVPAVEKATIGVRLRESFYGTLEFIQMVKLGLQDLISGRAGLQEMSGVVGIVGTMVEQGQAAQETGGISAGIRNVMYFVAFIAVNLAVMNLLPIPALDGGRIFALCITTVFTKLTGKRPDPKYEGYIHTVGFILLLLLMAVVAFNDIRRLFGWG